MTNNCVDFKTFSLEHLQHVISDLNINLTIKEMKKPTLENAITLQKGFLLALLLEKVCLEMDMSTANHFLEDDVKMYNETFKFLKLYIYIGELTNMCNFEAKFMEIFRPTRQVFFQQIGHYLEFSQCASFHLKPFSASQQKAAQYLERHKVLNQENEELLKSVFQLEIARKEKQKDIEMTRQLRNHFNQRLEESLAEKKKLQHLRATLDQEKSTLLVDKSEMVKRREAVQKKTILYEKILIKSPKRLKSDIVKTETRIVELNKQMISKSGEQDEQKKSLFDKEKFIENFTGVKELLEKFFQNEVVKANAQLKDIETTREETSNANCKHKQMKSTIAALRLDSQKLNNEFSLKEKLFEKESNELCTQVSEYESKVKGTEKLMDLAKTQFNETLEQREAFTARSMHLMNKGFEIVELCKKNVDLTQIATMTKEAEINARIDKANEHKEKIDKSNHRQIEYFKSLQLNYFKS
jgi:hypothetical protein